MKFRHLIGASAIVIIFAIVRLESQPKADGVAIEELDRSRSRYGSNFTFVGSDNGL